MKPLADALGVAMAQNNRPPKPRRKAHLQGIKAKFSAGRWHWRACVKVDGKQTVGPQRGTQEQAHADYLELRRTLLPVVGREARLGTLGDALDAHLEERERTDSRRAMFTHRSQARFLLGAWPRELPLASLEPEHLQAFIDGAVRQGRSPNTVRKYLHLLRRLFDRAGLAFPEGLSIPPAPRPQTHYLEPEELIELVRRIRTYKGDLDKLGRRKVVRQQERDAALVMFLGCTGIRLGELCRLTVADVDTRRREVVVLNRKVRTPGGERQAVPYGQHLDWAVQALLEGADEQGRLLANPTTANSIFRRWKQRLGLAQLNGRLLRHTEGTRALADSGHDLAATAHRLRHRQVTTSARYVHALHEPIRRSLEAQGERWAEAQTPDPPTDSD